MSITNNLIPSQEFVCTVNDEFQLAEISDPEHTGVTFASSNPNLISVDKTGKVKVIGFQNYGDFALTLPKVIASLDGKVIAKYGFSIVGKGAFTKGEGKDAQTYDCHICTYEKKYQDGKQNVSVYIGTDCETEFTISLSCTGDEFSWQEAQFEGSGYGPLFENPEKFYNNSPKLDLAVDGYIISVKLTAESDDGEKISIDYYGPMTFLPF
ncbi:MAG: hypothetical protein MJZ61_05560 [Bacteroidales bacterium]|nr:hypothetical protein [Bacteroidales bacterium]